MSLKLFFRKRSPIHDRMYEFEFVYINGSGQHQVTMAYVVATNETQGLVELRDQLSLHQCELRKLVKPPVRIEPEKFDDYIHNRWPEFMKNLVSKDMIQNHEHHVYVLPPIKLLNQNQRHE